MVPSFGSAASLVLEDGAVFKGFLFGEIVSVSGEVVFNTAMAGYPEVLTDPASAGQIVVMTYPLVGNYGVTGVDQESARIQARAVVVVDFSPEPSHWNARESLDAWLREQGVVGLCGVDTRALAKHLRDHGAQKGKIVADGLAEAPGRSYEPVRQTVGTGGRKICLIDCGCADSLVASLAVDNTVRRIAPGDEVGGYDVLVVAGGAGDPHDYADVVDTLRVALSGSKPVIGLGHGHLLMALAAGAKLQKLKYGHHGANQPVLVDGTNTALITRQNHIWTVDTDSLPDDWTQTHHNLNDNSNEGMAHKSKPFHSLQFTPEKIL